MPKKIAPLTLNIGDSPTMRNINTTWIEISQIIQIFSGVLAIIFNILFIYFGMRSGWYYFQDSLGTELKVISIGEGIIAGTLYFIFAGVCLLQSHKTSASTLLVTLNILNILIRNANFIIILKLSQISAFKPNGI